MGKAKVNISSVTKYRNSVLDEKSSAVSLKSTLSCVDAIVQKANAEIVKLSDCEKNCAIADIAANEKLSVLKAELSQLQSELASTPPTITVSKPCGTDDEGNTIYEDVEEPNPQYYALLDQIAAVNSKISTLNALKSELQAKQTQVSKSKNAFQEAITQLQRGKSEIASCCDTISRKSDSAAETLAKAVAAIQKYMGEQVHTNPVPSHISIPLADTIVIQNPSYVPHDKPFGDIVADTILGEKSAYDAKRFKDAGIMGAFDELPRKRRNAVYERFEDAPDVIKKIVKEYENDLRVEDTQGDDCCHYDLRAKKIRMEAVLDDSEYSEVFSHEYGHFVDDKKGNVSNTEAFRSALTTDLKAYDRTTEAGKAHFREMLDALMSSDAAYDRAVSDNLSACFRNDEEIMKRYFNEGVDYYRHKNDYWAIAGNREAELYANLFSMMAQRNEDSCNFMEWYFPNIWKQFKETL